MKNEIKLLKRKLKIALDALNKISESTERVEGDYTYNQSY
jgi:hypothetical protein